MTRGKKFAAVALSTIISLVAAEVVLRGFFPRRTAKVLAGTYPAMFEPSDTLPYRLRKNFSGRLASTEFDTRININSLGYRGEEFTPSKGDAKRVLILGDSFTFGWGVSDSDTYPAQLQRLLALAPGQRIEVINGGFAACYSPDTYYLYLKNEGLALNPDAIVVGLFVGNDLDSGTAFENEWLEKDANGLPLRITNTDAQVVDNYLIPRAIPVRYSTPVLSHLHVYQGLFDIWWELAPTIKAWWPRGVATTVYAAEGPEEQIPYIYRRRYEARTTAVQNRVQTLLGAMHKLAAEKGIPLYVMMIPEAIQLSPAAYAGFPADMEKPQREMAKYLDAAGIKHLDLLPALRERAPGRVLYFPSDAHFSIEGNLFAAEQLADFLVKEWLSPKPSAGADHNP